jgi:hypothetical protein
VELTQKLAYMEEHPAFSMIRGLVVYLVIVSGLYIAAADPFDSNQQASFTQYIRLAGMISLLGFVVGYDPSRFKSWLDLVPGPTKKAQATDGAANAPIDQVVQNTRVAQVQARQSADAVDDVMDAVQDLQAQVAEDAATPAEPARDRPQEPGASGPSGASGGQAD